MGRNGLRDDLIAKNINSETPLTLSKMPIKVSGQLKIEKATLTGCSAGRLVRPIPHHQAVH